VVEEGPQGCGAGSGDRVMTHRGQALRAPKDTVYRGCGLPTNVTPNSAIG
jgi:hypothetical protein